MAALLSGCTGGAEPPANTRILIVGAGPAPQAELLRFITEDLAGAGILLKVVEFTDYAAPNSALMAGELDANYFQPLPYLTANPQWKEALAPVFPVHVKPLGVYSRSVRSLSGLRDAARVAVPLDSARALLLLQAAGLIGLNPSAGLAPAPEDITGNPKNLSILAATDPAAVLGEMDACVFMGGDERERLALEDRSSPYVNWVVVKKGGEDDPRIRALKDALCSEKVKAYMRETWKGAIEPAF